VTKELEFMVLFATLAGQRILGRDGRSPGDAGTAPDATRPSTKGRPDWVHFALAYHIPTSSSIRSLTSPRFTLTGYPA
jgi:hypothetical protein